MPQEAIEELNRVEDNATDEEVLKTEDEMKEALTRLYYGDLYIIGRLWIDALRTVLVGAQWNLIPVLHAAKPPETPEKPPRMKYTELPIYKAPHYEYKDYVADKDKCPKANVKLIHEFLLPYVRNYRKETQKSYNEACADLRSGKKEVCDAINAKKKEFKKYMRDSNKLQMRQAVVALGGATGYYMGSGKGIPRRLFFTSLGVLATGALCFPKETDENIRNFSFYTAKFGIDMYNRICGKHFSMRERLPCKDDMPPPPKARKINPCPNK